MAKKHGAKARVTSEKLAVFFSRGTGGKVKKAAKRRTAGNVSAWLEEAAAERLRHEAMAGKKHGAKPRAAWEKLAVSFTRGMMGKVKKSARLHAAGNVSGWLEEAATERLRHEAGADLIAYYESRNGEITEDDLAAVEAKWSKKG